jgi:hypothetical protein
LLRSFCLAVEGYSAIACKPLILASFVVFIQRVVHHGFGFFFKLIIFGMKGLFEASMMAL